MSRSRLMEDMEVEVSFEQDSSKIKAIFHDHRVTMMIGKINIGHE